VKLSDPSFSQDPQSLLALASDTQMLHPPAADGAQQLISLFAVKPLKDVGGFIHVNMNVSKIVRTW
jgi:hypothetical protein